MADKAFTINFNSHAALVLSSGLYSDKITAVIRELACNAVDSHAASGHHNQAILVTLPTHNVPVFAVEDFGLGLSDSAVQTIYTSYFTSTKTNNNAMIGRLGLGSKSPFSLVREFFVESTFNGEYRKYRMYFDSTDTPRVHLSLSSKTTGANGVRVSFTVDDYNIDIFKTKALEVFKWFEVSPVVIEDGQQVPIENFTKKFQGSGWFIGDFTKFTSGNPVAVMGNIPYPLQESSIKNISTSQTALLRLNITIKFNIGDFDIAASRESIGYDTNSCDNIRNKLQIVIDELYLYIAAKIAAEPTEWQARLVYNSFFTDGEGMGHYLNQALSGRKFVWNGIEIKSHKKTVDMTVIYPVADNVNAIRASDGISSSLSRIKRNRFDQFIVDVSPRHAIVFDDLPRNGAARIKKWIEEQSKIFWNITIFDQPSGTATWDQLRQLLGNPPVTLTSSLDAPPTKEKKIKPSKEKMMKFSMRSTKSRPVWDYVDMDITVGGYYVDYLNKNPIDSQRNIVDLNAIISAAQSLGYINYNDVSVYAGTGSVRHRLAKLKNWINIVDLVTLHVNHDKRKYDEYSNTLATKASLERVSMLLKTSYDLPKYPWDIRDSSSKMQEVINSYRELLNFQGLTADKAKHIIQLFTELRMPRKQGTADPRVALMLSDLRTRYPMLFLLDYNSWKANFAAINEYVNMVDTAWVYFELTRPTVDDEEN